MNRISDNEICPECGKKLNAAVDLFATLHGRRNYFCCTAHLLESLNKKEGFRTKPVQDQEAGGE